MDVSLAAWAPALGLLLILGGLAWALHWLKQRQSPAGSGQGATLRLVSQLALGPQQRVVVVELIGPQGPVQLTLGVTPTHIRTLHTLPLAPAPSTGTPGRAPAAPSYAAVAQAVAQASQPAPPTPRDGAA